MHFIRPPFSTRKNPPNALRAPQHAPTEPILRPEGPATNQPSGNALGPGAPPWKPIMSTPSNTESAKHPDGVGVSIRPFRRRATAEVTSTVVMRAR
jgi:hypothetical protein